MTSICILSLALITSDPSGQIAFVSGTDPEDRCVCVVDVASGDVERLGTGNCDGAPVWSPDAASLAFETWQEGGMRIHTVRTDGAGSRALAHTYKWNRNPAWSPDGSKLAYTASDNVGMDLRIMVYDLKTGEESQWGGERIGLMRPVWVTGAKLLYGLRPGQMIEWGDSQVDLTALDWLEVGRVLLAIGLQGEPGKLTTDIFVVTPDIALSLPEMVLPSRGKYAEWAVLPDPSGSSLAFESDDGGDREIFVLSGKGPADVSNHRAADWNPVWSPNGDWIAFESFRSGRRGIYRVYPKTAGVAPVAAAPDTDNWWPSWSPDGEWIAFVSNRTGTPQVFVTDLRGEEARQLTNGPGFSYAPAWRPKVKE